MKHLRHFIRGILLEIDLGDKVWADRATSGRVDNHWGDEPDTKIEADLWNALRRYLGNASPIKDRVLLSAIKDAARDSRYEDIFITRDSPYWDDQGLMRGQSLPKKHVEQLLKIKIPSSYAEASEDPGWHHPWLDIFLPSPYLYKPEKFFREGEVSSWTPDDRTAKNFATSDPWTSTETEAMGIIFHAVRGSGEFLDLRQMYWYEGMGSHSEEEEFLALDDVLVDSISVYYEDPDRGSW
jgi:hypothetical protein